MAQDSGEVEAAKEIGLLAGRGRKPGITLQRSARGWLVEKRMRGRPLAKLTSRQLLCNQSHHMSDVASSLPRLPALLVVG